MGSNLIEAIFIGLSAGAAATGINQVGKQLSKDDTTSSVLLKVQNYLASLIDIADEEVEEDSEEENEIEEDCVEEKETSSEDEPSETDVPESDDVIDDDNAVEDDSQSDEGSPADEEDE
jgi:hypothetical protein